MLGKNLEVPNPIYTPVHNEARLSHNIMTAHKPFEMWQISSISQRN